MILRFVLSDPAKSRLEDSAWIDGYDYQKNDTQKNITIMKKKSVILSVQCIIKKPM